MHRAGQKNTFMGSHTILTGKSRTRFKGSKIKLGGYRIKPGELELIRASETIWLILARKMGGTTVQNGWNSGAKWVEQRCKMGEITA